MMKGKFHREYITIINVHAPNNRTHKYVNKKLTELRKKYKIKKQQRVKYLCYGLPKDDRWTTTYKLVWIVTLMILHIHQESIKLFVTHITRLSKESKKIFPKKAKNGLRAEKGDWLEFLW